MMKVLSISTRGQITIPTELRKKLNVTYVTCWINSAGDLVLSPLKTREDFFAELDAGEEDWEANGGFTLEEVKKTLKNAKV